jgi:hypothetical protein
LKARPSSLVLSAMGCSAPQPFVVMRPDGVGVAGDLDLHDACAGRRRRQLRGMPDTRSPSCCSDIFSVHYFGCHVPVTLSGAADATAIPARTARAAIGASRLERIV